MPLGEDLVARGTITQEQLSKALAAQSAGDSRRIGELVVALGFATKEEVEACMNRA
jgi:hypothetical protein